jgi:hypothetical protein
MTTVTVTISGIVHLSSYSTPGKPAYMLYQSDMSEYGHAPLGEASFEFELPPAFSPNAARVSVLEKERERINLEFAKRVKTINEQIAQLQAIEYVEGV